MAFTILAGKSIGMPPHYGVYPVRIVYAKPRGRLIALSDIHGRADLLERLLQRIDLRGEDTLVIVGDLIERGGESLKTVRMVMRLARRPSTFVLMGNMDAHKVWEIMSDTDATAEGLLFNIRSLGASLFLDMCREIGLDPRTEQEIREARPAVRKAFAAELDFLRTRPTVLDTPDWLFVHGGLPQTDLERLEGTEAFECMKFDDFVHRGLFCPKNTVVGHFPTNLYWDGEVQLNPYYSPEKRVLTIDGGCALRAEGQLNAVFLEPNGKYTHIYEDGFPTVCALDEQLPEPPSLRFRWPNSKAELIERREGWAYMRQSATGLETVVPDAFWGEGEDGFWVNDLSDARLGIRPGDRLGLIARANGGYYVKKEGVSGWYFGRIDLQ